MLVTVDTITDEQIQGLRRTSLHFLMPIIALTCTVALGEDEGATADERMKARERCAEAFNATCITDAEIREFMAATKVARSTPGHAQYDAAIGLFGPGPELSACADALNEHLDPVLRLRARASVAKVIEQRKNASLSDAELEDLERRLRAWPGDSPLAGLVRRAVAEVRAYRAFDVVKGGMCPLCQAEWGSAQLREAQQRCAGRNHSAHAMVTCEGTCCTECGGPIAEDEECRC